MLGYKDFAPQSLAGAADVQSGSYADIQDAVDAAKRWIEANGIDVVTIETIVVPVYASAFTAELLDDDAPTPPPAPLLPTGWQQFVRCWFRA